MDQEASSRCKRGGPKDRRLVGFTLTICGPPCMSVRTVQKRKRNPALVGQAFWPCCWCLSVITMLCTPYPYIRMYCVNVQSLAYDRPPRDDHQSKAIYPMTS